MSVKVTCDRCGSKVTLPAFGGEADYYHVSVSAHWIVAEASGQNKIDLCFKCEQDVGRFATKKAKR